MTKGFGPGGFRLLLTLVVYVHHSSSFGLGAMAVYLFFVLSGYWIAVMWQNKYSKSDSPYLIFIVSRGWRLLPVFLVCHGLQLLTLRLSERPTEIGLAHAVPYTLILGYNSLSYRPMTPAWSLDIEMQFYLMAPVLLWALRKNRIAAIAAVLSLSVLSTAYLRDTCVASFLPFFLTGIVAAQSRLRVSSAIALSSALAFATIMIGTLFLDEARPLLLGGAHRSQLYVDWNTPFNIALAVVATPIALWSISLPSDRRDKDFADLSYVIYLLHWVALTMLTALVPEYGTLPYLSRGIWVLFIAVLLGVSGYLMLYGLDRPLNRLRAAFVDRHIQQRNSIAAPDSAASRLAPEEA